VVLEKEGIDVGNASFPQKRWSEEEKEAIWQQLIRAGLPV